MSPFWRKVGKEAGAQRQRNRRACAWVLRMSDGKTQADVARENNLNPQEISRILGHACPPFLIPPGRMAPL